MNTDIQELAEMIKVVSSGVAKKVTKDNITVYKVGNIIRIDIKEKK